MRTLDLPVGFHRGEASGVAVGVPYGPLMDALTALPPKPRFLLAYVPDVTLPHGGDQVFMDALDGHEFPLVAKDGAVWLGPFWVCPFTPMAGDPGGGETLWAFADSLRSLALPFPIQVGLLLTPTAEIGVPWALTIQPSWRVRAQAC